ncbi:hypothetical protein [Chryseobacterium sp. BLS98]|nr:hypothetical protein [Chryseobacterium sp. BLS98]
MHKRTLFKLLSLFNGGWENGNEFVPKTNPIYSDGKMTFSFVS